MRALRHEDERARAGGESAVLVEDVDGASDAAVAHGATLLVPPTDIPPGRFSTLASPTGATFCLFHEADDSAQNAPAGDGAIHWVELHSTDLDADIAWLKSSFGLTVELMPMPEGNYSILKDGDTQVGGATRAMQPGVPSMWLVWVEVADVDAVGRRLEEAHQILVDALESVEKG